MIRDPYPGREYPELDGLRAIAIGLTLYVHWVYDVVNSRNHIQWYHYVFKLEIGGLGVTIFFVISGFLITRILVSNITVSNDSAVFSLRNFYVRRFLRLAPIYYITLIISVTAGYIPSKEMVWHFVWLSNILMFVSQNWVYAASHFWTLSIEEQFYIIWPVTIIALGRAKISNAALLIVGVNVTFRIALPLLFPDKRLFSVLPLVALDAVALGALLSVESAAKEALAKISPILAVAYLVLVTVSPAYGTHAAMEAIKYFLSLGCAIFLVYQAVQRNFLIYCKLLNAPVLRTVGVISYGIYVIHNFAEPILMDLYRSLHIQWIPDRLENVIALSTLTIVLALMSWHCLEKPIGTLKRYFPYRVTVPEKCR